MMRTMYGRGAHTPNRKNTTSQYRNSSDEDERFVCPSSGFCLSPDFEIMPASGTPYHGGRLGAGTVRTPEAVFWAVSFSGHLKTDDGERAERGTGQKRALVFVGNPGSHKHKQEPRNTVPTLTLRLVLRRCVPPWWWWNTRRLSHTPRSYLS